MTAAHSVYNDPDLGLINVYREYRPLQDEIEYTTFFRKDGKKYRNDFVLTASELEQASIDGNAVNYVRDRIYADIQAGNYRDATKAVQ